MQTLIPSAEDLKRLTPPALRGFFRISQLWDLDRPEQMALLGLTATSTYQKWKGDIESARLSRDHLERISYILGIYKALQILFPDTEIADSWVRRKNSGIPFNHRSPIEYMCLGKVQNLFEVRDYLDGHRGA